MTIQEIVDLFEQLELHLINSLKRNLMRHRRQEQDEGGKDGVPENWEAWQSAKLRDVRRFRRENEKILGEYMPTIEEETEKLLREQYAEGGADNFFGSSDPKLESLIHEMQNNEVRVKQGCLRYMSDVYRKTILRTATAMNAGGMSMHKAVDEATADFLAQGINCIRYSNGRLVNIASYAEMALRTCNTRAMLMGEAKQRERMGIDTVLVSQYGACSDTCLPWQGRVYIDDVFQTYNGPRTGSFGISRNGRQYMLLSVAIKGGLFHPNCRHTITTWIEGVSTMPKPMDVKEIERINKLEKTQRALERKVRKAKRRAEGLTDPEAQKAAKAKVREAQAELREFVKKNGDVLRRDPWRERNDLARSAKPVQEDTVPAEPQKAKPDTSEKLYKNADSPPVEKPSAEPTPAPAAPEPAAPAEPPKRYHDITGNWYPDAVPNSHPVQDLQSVTVNGVTYQVDGDNVKLEYSPHEKEIAELLEREVGGELYMVPKVNEPQSVRTADYLFHGHYYDLKTLEQVPPGKNPIYNPVKKSNGQTAKVIVDVTIPDLDAATIEQQVDKIFWSRETRFVDEIVIIRGDKIEKVFKRA